MTPKDLEAKTLSDMAGMVERRVTDVLILLEQIVFQAEPQNKKAESDIAILNNLRYRIALEYRRAKSSLNELQG
jgi:hypothetical protein